MGLREKQAEQRRREIIEAAATLFDENGYSASSMRELATAIEMHPGSIYTYFPSKEEILYEILDETIETYLVAVNAAVHDLDADTNADRLRAAAEAHMTVFAQDLERAGVLLNSVRDLGDERRAEITSRRRKYEEILRGVIEDGIRDGEFREDTDTKFVVTALVSMLNYSYHWFDLGGLLSPEAAGRRFADLVINSIETRP